MLHVSSLNPSSIAYLLSQGNNSLPISSFHVLVSPDNQTTESLYTSLKFFIGRATVTQLNVVQFKAWDVLPFDALSPDKDIVAERVYTLHQALNNLPTIVITTIESLTQKLIPHDVILNNTFSVTVEDPIDRDAFVTQLVASGYLRKSLVEEVGTFALRGAVIDLWTAGIALPIRLELFNGKVESIRTFEVESQRSAKLLSSVTILPASEFLYPWATNANANHNFIAAIKKIKRRASDLDIPYKNVEMLEDIFASCSDWIGLESLAPFVYPKMESFFDYLPKNATFSLYEESEIFDNLNSFRDLIYERANVAKTEGRLFPEPSELYLNNEAVLEAVSKKVTISFTKLNLLTSISEDIHRDTTIQQGEPSALPTLNKELHEALTLSRNRDHPLKPLADFIKKRAALGISIAIVVSTKSRIKRIIELLEPYQIIAEEFIGSFSEWRLKTLEAASNRFELKKLGLPHVSILHGECPEGFVHLQEKFLIISELEIFTDTPTKKPTRFTKSIHRLIGNINQIKEGDYVVHSTHGIAQYRGLKELVIEGKVGDFLLLEYRDNAKLYIPADGISSIHKYVGADSTPPQLTKLGTKSWSLIKEKVKKQVQEIAGQMLNLYAEREIAIGIAYSPENSADESFAELFPYEETEDQAKAIHAVLTDMAKTKPMDRLVCGDVGFGKTEVALRAAFKALSAGKQVAVLAPSTVLADQHLATFSERFKDYAYNIACVSRFYPPKQNKETLAKVASGTIDLIIGTHRLLQKDVFFKRLGLLIIDEEHRFGVTDKEKLKQLCKNIDVLTLTATPIPRTLQMSILDIRDLSIIETPPVDRQSIRTYLAEYQEGMVREAILRELNRQGQVFYIYNRVQGIAYITEELKKIVPEAKIEFAHGQMKEAALEKIMHRFINKEIDVLVSTTIVESGLDIPNANTIIIRNADKLGLAELYQLRGRVGRSTRRAEAYLLIDNLKQIGVEAKKRLQVLQSLDDLGMGFRLALQDMEIRGAGNLLGKDQSGKIELVGFDLYSRILKEAITELKRRNARRNGETLTLQTKVTIEPEINIGFPSHIPDFYIPDIEERLLMYQRLVELTDEQEGIELAAEITDRFGKPPTEVEILIEIMILRSYLKSWGIVSLRYKQELLTMNFHPETNINVAKLTELVSNSSGTYKLSPSGGLSKLLANSDVETPADITKQLSHIMKRIM